MAQFVLAKVSMGQDNQTKESRAKETLLVVDDDESVRRGLYWTLNSEYRVLEAASREEAVKLLQQENIDLVQAAAH